MRLNIVIVLLFIFIADFVSAQIIISKPSPTTPHTKRFFRVIGDNTYQASLSDIKPTTDGGYIAVGQVPRIPTGNGFDGWIIKFDSEGNKIWQSQYASDPGIGTQFSKFNRVIETNSGDFIVLAWNFSLQRPWLIKLSSTGSLLTHKVIQEISPVIAALTLTAIISLDNGNFLLVGTASGSPSRDQVFIEFDSALNNVSSVTFRDATSAQSESLNGTVRLQDGGTVTAGYRTSSVDEGSVSRFSSDGTSEWQTTFRTGDPNNSTIFFDTVELPIGDLITVGLTQHLSNPDKVGVIAKISSVGAPYWIKTYDNGQHNVRFTNIARSTGGGLFVSGLIGSDGLLLKIDSTGSVLWSKRYLRMNPIALEATADGGAILAGTESGTYNAALLKVDQFGRAADDCTDILVAGVVGSVGGYLFSSFAHSPETLPWYSPSGVRYFQVLPQIQESFSCSAY